MTAHDRWTDEREIRIRAAPARVWAAWAEPEHVRRWFSDEAHGAVEPGAELVHVFHGHGEHRYRVVEAEEPVRLVLEGAMEEGAFRQVTVLRSEGGATVLRLVHSGFGAQDPESETVQGIDSGWTMALALLKHYTEERFGRDKRSFSVFRPARCAYHRLLTHHYLSAEGLGAWLTDGAGAIEEGRPVRLTLRGGRPLSGRVLARTDHEVSLSWDEIGGAVELKAFGASPETRMMGVRVVSWQADDDLVGTVRSEMEAAVERLAAAVGG